jgi:hypothetical protein
MIAGLNFFCRLKPLWFARLSFSCRSKPLWFRQIKESDLCGWHALPSTFFCRGLSMFLHPYMYQTILLRVIRQNITKLCLNNNSRSGLWSEQSERRDPTILAFAGMILSRIGFSCHAALDAGRQTPAPDGHPIFSVGRNPCGFDKSKELSLRAERSNLPPVFQQRWVACFFDGNAGEKACLFHPTLEQNIVNFGF